MVLETPAPACQSFLSIKVGYRYCNTIRGIFCRLLPNHGRSFAPPRGCGSMPRKRVKRLIASDKSWSLSEGVYWFEEFEDAARGPIGGSIRYIA